MIRLLRRFVCLLADHRWRVLRENRIVQVYLGHLSPLIGVDADCDRCGEHWRDYANFDRDPWGRPRRQPMPDQEGGR